MPERRDALIDAIIDLQHALARTFRAAAGSRLLAPDLTMAQLKTLIVLADDGPLSISQVAEALGVGLPTASHLVDRLVKANLARREEDPTDRRRALTRLSDEGAEVIDRLRQGSQDQLRHWLVALTDDDLGALAQGLRALVQAAEAARPAGTEPAPRPPCLDD